MGRPVRWRAPPTGETEIKRAILDSQPINVQLYNNPRGRYQDKNGAWITYGVGPNGASDLIGYRVIRITPEMVGKRLAQFVALEVKTEKGKPSDEQQAYIDNIVAAGGCAGLCRSAGDSAALLLDLPALKRRRAA